MLSFASVQLCFATFVSYYLSTYALERDGEHYRNMYGTCTVPYCTVPYRTGGQLSDGDGPPVGTPYKVKSRPHWVPCDVARSQRVPSEGTFSSPPYGGDANVPYKVGLTNDTVHFCTELYCVTATRRYGTVHRYGTSLPSYYIR